MSLQLACHSEGRLSRLWFCGLEGVVWEDGGYDGMAALEELDSVAVVFLVWVFDLFDVGSFEPAIGESPAFGAFGHGLHSLSA